MATPLDGKRILLVDDDNDILTAMQPRLHLFGHHHRFSDQHYEGVRSIGLDLVTRGYLLIDPGSLQVDAVKY